MIHVHDMPQKAAIFYFPKGHMIDRPANPNLFWNNYEELETWNLSVKFWGKYPLF